MSLQANEQCQHPGQAYCICKDVGESRLASATGSASTHDYTKRYWGHDYTITDVRKRGMEISMMGWGHGISEGDYMLIEGQSTEPGANPDTRYRVKTILYLGDPPDMWSMEATFAPRMTPNEKAEPSAMCSKRTYEIRSE